MKLMLLGMFSAVFLLACHGYVIEEPATKESVLKEDLYSLRNAIDQFTQEHNRAPESFEDLVSCGYLREIPIDPLTGSRLTWEAVYDEPVDAPHDVPTAPPNGLPKHKGIVDVRSGSHQIASDGTRYSDW